MIPNARAVGVVSPVHFSATGGMVQIAKLGVVAVATSLDFAVKPRAHWAQGAQRIAPNVLALAIVADSTRYTVDNHLCFSEAQMLEFSRQPP